MSKKEINIVTYKELKEIAKKYDTTALQMLKEGKESCEEEKLVVTNNPLLNLGKSKKEMVKEKLKQVSLGSKIDLSSRDL